MEKIDYAGTQITQCGFQHKGKSSWTGTSSFHLKVPLHYLSPIILYHVTGSCKGPSAPVLVCSYAGKVYRVLGLAFV